MFNILFTSVGRRVELLRAFRRAYQSLGLEGQIVALDIDPLAPALELADQPYIVPRVRSIDYIPTLLSICEREQVKLILPLIDPDIPVLAENRQAIEASGARLGIVSSEAAATVSDKWLTTRFFRDLNLVTPRSWLPNQIEPATSEFPVFIKPRNGSAGKSAFVARNVEELSFFSHYVPDPIIQEYIAGPEVTSDVVCDLDGELLTIISRKRIEVRSGEVAKGVTVYDPAIIEACSRIAQELPAIGPITVQCLMKNGVAHFTEINARLGGGAPQGIAAGADWPCWLLARSAKLPIHIPPLGSYQTGLYLTRFDDSFFLTEAQREAMAGHHL